jgi:RHH-type rel operon transcriptional repressor/antitoxin RelB
MATATDETTTITARIPKTLREELEALARSTGRNKNTLVADALRRFVDLQRWQIAQIEEGIRAADAGEFATDDEMNALWAKYGLEAEDESGSERAAG